VTALATPLTEVAPTSAAAALDERSRAILDLERGWWKVAGAKEDAIRERLGISASRYYELLGALLDDEAALAHDPMLVRRLRRLRAARQRSRAEQRTGAAAG
jgi:hypothetical protein